MNGNATKNSALLQSAVECGDVALPALLPLGLTSHFHFETCERSRDRAINGGPWSVTIGKQEQEPGSKNKMIPARRLVGLVLWPLVSSSCKAWPNDKLIKSNHQQQAYQRIKRNKT